MMYFFSHEVFKGFSVFGEEMFENIVDEDVEVTVDAIKSVEFESGRNDQVKLHEFTKLRPCGVLALTK